MWHIYTPYLCTILSVFSCRDKQNTDTVVWQFTDIALEYGAQDQYKRNRGAGGADFDGDGDIDILLTNPYEQPTLLLYEGSSFQTADFPTTGTDTAPALADFDGDGDVDVYLSCGGWITTCQDMLIRNDGVHNGSIQWTDATDILHLQDEPHKERASFGGSWVDWDNDGDLDLHVAVKDLDDCTILGADEPCEETEDFFFENNREQGFTNIAFEIGIKSNVHSHQAAWLDYDLDGDMDMFLPVFGANNHLFANDGTGHFTDVTETMGSIVQHPISAFGAVSEDVNHDGYPDLILSSFAVVEEDMIEEDSMWQFAPEPQRLFINDHGERFIEGTPSMEHINLIQPTMGFQIADIDLDGNWDIFLGNGNPLRGYENALISLIPHTRGIEWIDRSATIHTPAPTDTSLYPTTATYPYRSHGTVFYDFDGDHDIDLYIGNGGAAKLDHLAETNDPCIPKENPIAFFVMILNEKTIGCKSE